MRTRIDGPFNHTDMQNIRNYSGKTEGYANSIPRILLELGMEDESERFKLTVIQGAFAVVDEIVRLVTEYPKVQERFGKASFDIIAALYLKAKTGSLNALVGEGKNELQDTLSNPSVPDPQDELAATEEAERLSGLAERMREPCIRLVEHEFPGPEEQAFVGELKNRDFQDLCALLLVYTGKGGHNKDSELFKLYCETSGIPMTDDRLLGPLHTRFAKKIRYVFENMRKDDTLRSIRHELN
jgi:hypothetical protein